MMMTLTSLRRLGFALVASTAATVSVTAQQAPNIADVVRFREIGPTRQGGRYVEYAVYEAAPRIFYAATGSGGLWKTHNSGITFESVFDNQPVISIGAVAVAQTDSNLVYVGTGEANNSRSTYYGDGVYKSTDGGRTWRNVGLPNSGHIGRIVINPRNPQIVFVAALGHLYSENPDRGLYRSADGGATWTKVLDHKVDGRSIGVVEVQMDPVNPQVLYAATYDKVRRPWTFGEGGPGSAVWKSTDGGVKWTMLTAGLPTGLLGRIGISIARNAPSTVYAVIENANAFTGDAAQRKARMAQGFGGGTIGDELYRSDDAGKTFRKVAGDLPPAAAGAGGRGGVDTTGGRGGGGRGGADTLAAGGGRGGGRGAAFGADPPYYYAQIRVDPNNKEHIYQLGVGVIHSMDGGRTWQGAMGGFGGDNHALWINPKDSDHMILGYDHGMGVTYDGGRNWLHPDNKPLAQFYAIAVDNDYPYNVYGGLQDNGSVKGPSSTRSGGSIPFEAWYRTGGGDGMYNVVDWKDSRWLYNESQFGPLNRVDQKTGETKSIRYTRPTTGGRGGGGGGGGGCNPADTTTLRWNWNAPILVSPHNSDVIFHASNILLRSPFRGETWQEISPDLTVNDPARRCGTGNIQYATITTIDESPIVPGLLWVGTDDGNVQVSRNGGGTWTNVRSRITGHQGHWVSRVTASHHDPAVAYVSATGMRSDDFKPYVWKTTDYGQTWTSIVGNLPTEAINVIREDHKNPNLLFVGTDMGVFASIDGGRAWTRLRNGMPTNPAYDIVIHQRENELVVGTHGRGIFIADIVPLQGLTTQALSTDVALFDLQPTVQWVSSPQPVTASLNYSGQSRPTGMPIHYYLRAPVTGGVTVRVYDGARVIAETAGPAAVGINTVRWNLQQRREVSEAETAGRGGGGRGGRGGGGGGGGGGRGGRGGAGGAPVFPAPGAANVVLTNVLPGEYRVELQAGNTRISKTAMVLADHWAK